MKDRRRRVGDISTALFLLNEAAALAAPHSSGPGRSPPRDRMGRRWRRRVSSSPVPRLRPSGGRCSVARHRLLCSASRWPCRPIAPSTSFGFRISRSRFRPMALRSPTSARTQVRRPSGALSFESVHSPASRSAICPGRFCLHQPFFSPDGQSVAFFTRSGELKKVALSGGNPVTLVEKIAGSLWTFGVWLPSGTIVFGGPGTAGLKQVPADGGSPTTLTSVDVAQGELAHYPGRPMRPRRALWSSPRRSVNSAIRGSRP